MKHALRCLAWGWRRRAGAIEQRTKANPGHNPADCGAAMGFARGLRFCAEAVFRAIGRAERRAGKGKS